MGCRSLNTQTLPNTSKPMRPITDLGLSVTIKLAVTDAENATDSATQIIGEGSSAEVPLTDQKVCAEVKPHEGNGGNSTVDVYLTGRNDRAQRVILDAVSQTGPAYVPTGPRNTTQRTTVFTVREDKGNEEATQSNATQGQHCSVEVKWHPNTTFNEPDIDSVRTNCTVGGDVKEDKNLIWDISGQADEIEIDLRRVAEEKKQTAPAAATAAEPQQPPIHEESGFFSSLGYYLGL
jgi:hypothetical protein